MSCYTLSSTQREAEDPPTHFAAVLIKEDRNIAERGFPARQPAEPCRKLFYLFTRKLCAEEISRGKFDGSAFLPVQKCVSPPFNSIHVRLGLKHVPR